MGQGLSICWDEGLVSVLRGVVLGRYDQAATLPGASVNSLDDVNHLLLVFHGPVDLVVVSGPQVNHDVLVPEEKHDSTRVV